MSKEADARRARRERIQAMTAADKARLIAESEARQQAEAEDRDAIHDPVLGNLMDQLLELWEPVKHHPTIRPLYREARSLRRLITQEETR